MIDNVDDISAHYSSDPGKEHGRLERHQLEHDLASSLHRQENGMIEIRNRRLK